jgi:hypothetical protein
VGADVLWRTRYCYKQMLYTLVTVCLAHHKIPLALPFWMCCLYHINNHILCCGCCLTIALPYRST